MNSTEWLVTVPLIDNEQLNCFESTVLTLAGMWNKEPVMLFEGAWDFHYEPATAGDSDSAKLGLRVKSSTFEPQRNLEVHVGIRMDEYLDIPVPEGVALAAGQIRQGTPVLFTLDGYYCPWHPDFERNHADHLFMVTGIDVTNGFLICADQMFTRQLVKLSYRGLKGLKVDCTVFRPVLPAEPSPSWAKVLSREMFRKLKTGFGTGCFTMMRQFACDVGSLTSLKEETDHYTRLETCPLLAAMTRLMNGRLNYAALLERAARDCGKQELQMHAKQLGDAALEWKTISNLLLKTCFLPKPGPAFRRLETRILRLADLEESIARGIESIVRDDASEDECHV
ncbi:hypothetical protein [Paenibacillus tarimensis]|uniref:hypothetical protein n=1 Tax=Paenibacillus tarimensis TaxID=416012 RepID=UPI001F1E618D|nr:hypothetical protein [Paenibacillus tarimensis]MCF2945193.1 hypothetical protein [Paenibacillus tarimensis]